MKDYIKKYLKYKNKYIKFKNKYNNKNVIIKGGSDTFTDIYDNGYKNTEKYRQASGFVLYRIKLGYIYNYKNHYINFMGEAFDLSIATTNTFFGALKMYYSLQHGIHFTIDKFILELMEITKTPDDKTEKRKVRLNFLKKCNNIRYLQILFRDMCSYLNGGVVDKKGLIFTVSGGNILKIFVKLIDGFNNDLNNSYNPYKFFVNIEYYNNNKDQYIDDIKNLCGTPEFEKMKKEAEHWSDFDFSLLYKKINDDDDGDIKKLLNIINPNAEDKITELIKSNETLGNDYIGLTNNSTIRDDYFKFQIHNGEKTVCDVIDSRVEETLELLEIFIEKKIKTLTETSKTSKDIKNTIRILKTNNINDFISNYHTAVIGEFLYPQIIQKDHLKKLETNYDNILKSLEIKIEKMNVSPYDNECVEDKNKKTLEKLNKIKTHIFSDKSIYIKIVENLLAKKELIAIATKINIYNILNEYTNLLFSKQKIKLKKNNEEEEKTTKYIKNYNNFPVLHKKTGIEFEDTKEKPEFELFIIIDYLFSICNTINSKIIPREIPIQRFESIFDLCQQDFIKLSVEIMYNFKEIHNQLYEEINTSMIQYRKKIIPKKFNILKAIMSNYKTEVAKISAELDYTKFQPHVPSCQISANIIELNNYKEDNDVVLEELRQYFSPSDTAGYINQTGFTTQELLLEDTNQDNEDMKLTKEEKITGLYSIEQLEKDIHKAFHEIY